MSAGGRVKAPACHSSLTDVYWKSFSQATREILPALYLYIRVAAGQVLENLFSLRWRASIGKIIGRKKRLDLSMKLLAALHNAGCWLWAKRVHSLFRDDACFLSSMWEWARGSKGKRINHTATCSPGLWHYCEWAECTERIFSCFMQMNY